MSSREAKRKHRVCSALSGIIGVMCRCETLVTQLISVSVGLAQVATLTRSRPLRGGIPPTPV